MSRAPVRRRRRWISAGLLLLLVAASVSVSAGRTLQVVDASGAPLVGYVVYRYQGSIQNFVHPVTYDASGFAVARTGGDGRAAFPFAVHVHWPFPFQTHPWLQVEMVYAPAQHNAAANLARVARSRANDFAYDPAGRRVVIHDARDQPQIWEGALGTLSSMIQRVVPKPFGRGGRLRDRDPASADLALELIDHFRREYDAFLVRHAATPLPPPVMARGLTPEEQRRWHQMVADNLKVEATWGDRVTRLHRAHGSLFREYEAELR